jgi:hypothetical protein
MEEVGEKAEEGDWAREYIDKTWNRQAPLPPPTTPLLPVRATRLRIGLHLGREATCRLSLTWKEKG